MTERARLRLVVLRVLMFSLLISLVGRLYYIQIVDRWKFEARAKYESQRSLLTAPVRGQILDAQGRPLASNKSQIVVFVDAVALLKQKDLGVSVLMRLARVLPDTYEELRNRITPCQRSLGTHAGCWQGDPVAPIPISADTPPALAQRIVEHLEDFPGISVQSLPVRHYDAPSGVNAAQLLGYLQPLSETERKNPAFANYDSRQLVGRTGLEKQYEKVLAGQAGVQTVAIDALNQISGTISESAPVAGDNLVLSLDAQLQALTEKSVAYAVEHDPTEPDTPKDAKTGAAVVMDAQTGRVLAMASYPTYDPSIWIGGIEKTQYSKLLDDPYHPLFNQAVGGAIPPGSVFKLVTTIGAVDDGLASFGGQKYDCPASVMFGKTAKHNYENTALGRLTLHDIIVQSCDTSFYNWAIRQYNADQAAIKAGKQPKETQAKVAREFGFGKPTGIDLPGESAGLIEDRASKYKRWVDYLKDFNCKAAKNPNQTVEQRAIAAEQCLDGGTYRIGDQANFNIGQGTVLVTPLQLATAYSALVNGGKLYSPKLAWGVLGADGKVKQTIKPTVRGTLTAGASVLSDIQSAMCDVPLRGTAKGTFQGFDFTKVTVCGKTGTAQMAKGLDDTSWFASFGGPVSDPKRYVVVAVVPEGGNGAETAAPLVRNIWEGMFGLASSTAIELATKLPKFKADGTLASPAPRATRLPDIAPTGNPATPGLPSVTPTSTPTPTPTATPTPTPSTTGTGAGVTALGLLVPVALIRARHRWRPRR